jgi:SAM-dependent methyltransferase
MPAAHLRELVAGSPDPAWFIEGGRRAAESIGMLLGRHGIDVSATGALLDFGCGCGRVVRHWRGLRGRVHGSDLNPRLVSWARRHLPFASFDVNGLAPPLRAADSAFDVVYALSVFTHLPEDLQRPWLDELRRVTAAGGHLVVSFHGESYRPELTP